MKVSVTADIVRNLMCLNIKDVIIPKNTPIAMETTARAKNCNRIVKGVDLEK
jgi:hypothetical protein